MAAQVLHDIVAQELARQVPCSWWKDVQRHWRHVWRPCKQPAQRNTQFFVCITGRQRATLTSAASAHRRARDLATLQCKDVTVHGCSALSGAEEHSCPASCWYWQAGAIAHTLQAVSAPRSRQQSLLLICGRGAARICIDARAATLCCPGAKGWQSASLRCCLQTRKVLLASASTHVTSGVHSTDPERASSACAPIRDLHLDRNRHCVHGVL